MFGSPLPTLAAGLGEASGLVAMLLIVLARHIDAVLLHVVAVVAEAIDILVGDLDAGLKELVVLVVAHRQRGIEGAGDEEVDVLCDAHPLVVEVIFVAHADGQLSEAYAPDAHSCTPLCQRVLAAC